MYPREGITMAIKTRFSVEQITSVGNTLGAYRAEALELAADAVIHWLNHGTTAVMQSGYSILSLAEKPKKGVRCYTRQVYLDLLKLKAFTSIEGNKFQSESHKPLIKGLRGYVSTLPDSVLSDELMVLITAWLRSEGWIEETEAKEKPELSADLKKALSIVPATPKGFEGLSDQMVAAIKSVWLAASGEPWSEGSVKRIKAMQ